VLVHAHLGACIFHVSIVEQNDAIHLAVVLYPLKMRHHRVCFKKKSKNKEF